jgi:hypothetical protein
MFAKRLVAALEAALPKGSSVEVFALVPKGQASEHPKGPPFRMAIDSTSPAAYERALEAIHAGGFSAVVLQHEYALWGPEGDFAVCFARALRVPSLAVVRARSPGPPFARLTGLLAAVKEVGGASCIQRGAAAAGGQAGALGAAGRPEQMQQRLPTPSRTPEPNPTQPNPTQPHPTSPSQPLALRFQVHTLNDNLGEGAHSSLRHLAASASRLLVMSPVSRNLLGSYHGIPFDRVSVVPHGVPDMADVAPAKAKAAFGWGNRTVLLTHGLLHQVRAGGGGAVLAGGFRQAGGRAGGRLRLERAGDVGRTPTGQSHSVSAPLVLHATSPFPPSP